MRLPSSLSLLLLAFLLCLTGCVRQSTFDRKVHEVADLRQIIEQLDADLEKLRERNRELGEKNSALNADLVESISRNSSLQQDLMRARADIERVEKVLSARSEEAGKALSELRRTVDRLEEEKRELERRVEEERIAREARIARMKSTYDELVEKMETEIERGEITISELQGKLTVNLVERILFDSGEAEVKAAGLEILSRVGDVVKEVTDKGIQVEGYTDNIPISPRLQQTFPSNWELSTARAVNVVRYLQETVGIPGERLAACGYGEFHPVADNATPEGRAQNRRIQIVLVPLERPVVEPLP